MSQQPLSGAQHEIRHGDQRAVVVEVGANLRIFEVGDRPVIVPFGEDEIAPASHGAVLVPWPNRLGDGRYEYGGRTLDVPINEPERRTALHGLGSWQRWVVTDRSPAAVELELRLPPSPGYPFEVRFAVRYALGDDGLTVTARATNDGATTAPYGTGFHPWLSPGAGSLEDCTFQLDAASHVLTDDRLLPTGAEPVSGQFDLRSPRPASELSLDDAFLEPLRDADGLSWARLTGADGRTAAVWMDGSMDTWQACTGDAINPPQYRRTGMAAEPMTCIADAFRTGDRLIQLAPGTSHEVRWGIRLL